MLKTKYLFIILLCFSIFSFGLQSQEKIPLLDLIKQLETQFDVKFSYTENDVSNVYVNSPKATDAIDDIISNLNASTLLNFKFLDARYITVSTLNKRISICGTVISKLNNEFYELFGEQHWDCLCST